MSTETDAARSRRSVLLGGLGAVGATVVAAVGLAEPVDAASPVILGGANTETTTTAISNTSAGATAIGLSGRLSHATSSPASAGLKGEDDGSNGTGVFGVADKGTTARGVYGQSVPGHGVEGASISGIGVFGHSSTWRGVVGNSVSGIGVYGNSGTVGAAGVGTGDSTSVGVSATSANGTGLVASGGVYGVNATGGRYGVSATAPAFGFYAPGGASYGFYGSGTTSGADFFGGPWGAYAVGTSYGIEGIATPASGTGYGVYGYASTSATVGYGVYGYGNYAGVYGSSVYVGAWGGDSNSRPTYGLVGYGATYGLWCTGASYAVYASGNVYVSGTLSKAAGAFKIDHPLDPERKWLSHSFVESPDMMNVYNGNAVLDAKGAATISLPKYFSVLNRDFRYQLTALGGAAPSLHVSQKVTGNTFRIAGGSPGLEVSWQVTGIRQDDYAKAHPIVVETRKTKQERGTRQFVPAGSASKRMDLAPRHVTQDPAAKPHSQPLHPRG